MIIIIWQVWSVGIDGGRKDNRYSLLFTRNCTVHINVMCISVHYILNWHYYIMQGDHPV